VRKEIEKEHRALLSDDKIIHTL